MAWPRRGRSVGRDGGGRSDATGAVGRTRAMGWDGTGRDDGRIRRRARGSGTRVETVTGMTAAPNEAKKKDKFLGDDNAIRFNA